MAVYVWAMLVLRELTLATQNQAISVWKLLALSCTWNSTARDTCLSVITIFNTNKLVMQVSIPMIAVCCLTSSVVWSVFFKFGLAGLYIDGFTHPPYITYKQEICRSCEFLCMWRIASDQACESCLSACALMKHMTSLHFTAIFSRTPTLQLLGESLVTSN